MIRRVVIGECAIKGVSRGEFGVPTPGAGCAPLALVVSGSVSPDRLHQLHGLHAQRMRQRDNIQQSYIAFTTFDAADIVAVQVRQLGQRFLGQAALGPPIPSG
jgi:hypothetical protein